MIDHEHSYIICATPRSGSTLLCDLLADTGIAGKPNSFFRRETFIEWAHYLNVSVDKWNTPQEFDHAYLSAILKEGASGTSVFGMRLMRESINELSEKLDVFYPEIRSDSARFQAAFGSLSYIHLSRNDKVAQAVSYLKAKQSGLWHVFADGSERERLSTETPLSYDAEQLSKLVSQAEQDDLVWTKWFSQQNIVPLCLSYEDLATDPKKSLRTVLSHLGLDTSFSEKAQIISSKLADKQSIEWITRFQKENINNKK